MQTEPILRITNLSKSFGSVQALQGVHFELRRGEIHAVAGENGAGKSTLMKIVDGILHPDEGEIVLDGEPVRIDSPAKAQRLGIGFVHQEIALCPDITVAENMFMAATNTSRALLMEYRNLMRRAAEILHRFSDINPSALVRNLSISQQQLVEIAKALTLECRVLILDEPTAALTEREARILFGIVRSLADQGISIIYISHRMAEIFENCDRVTVLRDGRHITTLNISETSPAEVVSAMVGRVIDKLYPEKLREEEKSDEIILDVRGVSERQRFRDISFQLRRARYLGSVVLSAQGAAK
jgi:ribose transport system ATP-binding protein